MWNGVVPFFVGIGGCSPKTLINRKNSSFEVEMWSKT